MYWIVTHPQVYKKLQKEIDTAVEKGTITFPVVYAQANKLEYFQACIKEVLRIHSAIDWPLPRIIPKGGAEINGHWFDSNVEVSMSPVWFSY